ncbi:hypothetical protein PN416_18260, partial [Halorubrum ezzemoulense]
MADEADADEILDLLDDQYAQVILQQTRTLFSRLAEPGALVPLARQKRVCMKTVLPSARGYQNLRNL